MGGSGLSGISRDGGERFATGVRRGAGTGRVPGSVLIAVAAWLLALTGGGALVVSFSALYAYTVTVRRQDAASVIEALLLDLLMTVFTLLALGLSRAGKSPGPSCTRCGSSWPRRRRPGGLRRMVLNAAPLPALPQTPAAEAIEHPSTRKAVLLALYRAHPGYGDRGRASRVAAELAAQAGLQAGTARSYLYAELDGKKS